MKITFDSKNDVMRIKFQEGKYEVSKELVDGVIIDVTKDNKILAIEILNASERIPKKEMKEITIGAAN